MRGPRMVHDMGPVRLAVLACAALAICPVLGQEALGYADSSCHVGVHISARASAVESGGHRYARQNPDGTYYPGDAFDFGITVSWTPNCWHIYTRPVRSEGVDIGTVQTGPVSYDETGGHFEEYGHAEIGAGSRAAYISQVVEAFGLVCGIDKCYKGYTSGSGDYAPAMEVPQETLRLVVENLTDRDGYVMRNGDGTYYIWDGIDVVFDPQYRWKQERFGTIDARTEPYSDLMPIGRYECHKMSCPYALYDPAITPWTYNFEFEQGFAAYNSTADGELGRHLLRFHCDIYNLGRKIAEADSSVPALLVRYHPLYQNYPYVVLKDRSSWWGFGKTPAVALRYLGSEGGGPDDGGPEAHQDRRSKINGFAYASFAYRVEKPVPLNESMAWKGAFQASFTDGNFTYRDDALQPGRDSAMFVRSGYGKIEFSDPVLYPILRTRYENATVINTLLSLDFAGHARYNLTGYWLSYPQTRFSTDVIVLALHQNGTIDRIPLSLSMVPDSSENASYEQDFVRKKVTHDRDRIFAGIVLSDMYGRGDHAGGLGVVNMRANLTSMAMPSVYRVFGQDPLDLPLSLVYEQPSPYNVTITADGRRVSFLERAFEFDTGWKYVVNTDRDNVLNATGYGGEAVIYPDPRFGPYASVLVDGKQLGSPCAGGCAVLLPGREENVTLEAFNAWGGMASRTLGAYHGVHGPGPGGGDGLLAVLVVAVSAILYGTVRRHVRP